MSLIILISGRGSNLHAILKTPLHKQVRAVISSNPAAPGLGIAAQFNIPTHTIEKNADGDNTDTYEKKLIQCIDSYSPRLIALAGFMLVLSAQFVRHYAGRLVNIHPSLLPQFKGLHTHRRALAAKATQHGCTVHYVSEDIDSGETIAQATVPVLPDDTEDTLAQRVLEKEHQLYPQVLQQLLNKGKHNAD